METGNFQNDFFGNQLREKKGRKPHLLEKYYRQRALPHIKIPVEYVVIGAIGILVLVIISYAIGVERGKVILAAKPARMQEEASFAARKKQPIYEVADKVLPEAEPKEEAILPKVTKKLLEEKIKEEVIAPEEAAYVVQLASFRRERAAIEEMDKLKRKGIKARLAKKGDWYQVYVGCQTIGQAKKARQELIADYEDCYIRKMN